MALLEYTTEPKDIELYEPLFILGGNIDVQNNNIQNNNESVRVEMEFQQLLNEFENEGEIIFRGKLCSKAPIISFLYTHTREMIDVSHFGGLETKVPSGPFITNLSVTMLFDSEIYKDLFDRLHDTKSVCIGQVLGNKIKLSNFVLMKINLMSDT